MLDLVLLVLFSAALSQCVVPFSLSKNFL
jgi:hypothetical protein